MTTISVSDTIDAVASNKYNKNNILVVCIISIALFGLSSYAESFLKTKENFWLTIIIPCIMYFFINGYYVITANNEINKKESVFPPISEISDILNKGFVYSIGILLISTVLYFIPFIIFTVGLLFTFKPLYQLLNYSNLL